MPHESFTPRDYPAVFAAEVTDAHAAHCARAGHSTWEAADGSTHCARCGQFGDLVPAEAITGPFIVWCTTWLGRRLPAANATSSPSTPMSPGTPPRRSRRPGRCRSAPSYGRREHQSCHHGVHSMYRT